MVERLWGTVKYEEVYPKDYESVAACRHSLAAYFEFCNRGRRHQSFECRAPWEVCQAAG